MVGPAGPIGPQGLTGASGRLLFQERYSILFSENWNFNSPQNEIVFNSHCLHFFNASRFIREQAKTVLVEKMVNLDWPVLLVRFYDSFAIFETMWTNYILL